MDLIKHFFKERNLEKRFFKGVANIYVLFLSANSKMEKNQIVTFLHFQP
jgi:hypothetical protein